MLICRSLWFLVSSGDWSPVTAVVRGSTARWRDRSARPAGRVHRSGVRADQRLCLAASAADVRHVLRHRASPLHGMDRGWPVASAASGGAGRNRGPGRSGLDLGDRRRGLRSRQKGDRRQGRTRSIAAKRAASCTCCLMLRASLSPPPCQVRTCTTVSPSSRSSSALPPSVPPGTTAAPARQTPRRQGLLLREHLIWLRERGLVARIARPGIESGERLGRHRWKIERSIAWLFGYRRLTIRRNERARTSSPWPLP